MIVLLIIRDQIVHIDNREPFRRICFAPASEAAGPSEKMCIRDRFYPRRILEKQFQISKRSVVTSRGLCVWVWYRNTGFYSCLLYTSHSLMSQKRWVLPLLQSCVMRMVRLTIRKKWCWKVFRKHSMYLWNEMCIRDSCRTGHSASLCQRWCF